MTRVQVEHHVVRGVGGLGMLAVCGLLFGPGCGPDPQGKFDEFTEQTKEGSSTGDPGTTTDEPTGGTGATTGGPPVFDISGDFLLAVSTVVDQTKPLQFIATNMVTEMDGKMLLASCLQPLTLMAGKVTVPRVPIGDPLCFEGLEIVDGAFTIDAGIVMVTGEANPITGANIVASLIMAGTIKTDDFYCGTVTGEVMEPPVGDIAGSNFAAVRLADKKVLPTDVTITCDGKTVTDM